MVCVQKSLSMEVEELLQDNMVSLVVERRRGTFGRLTVHWAANGSLDDIFPDSGVVSCNHVQDHTKDALYSVLVQWCATLMLERATIFTHLLQGATMHIQSKIAKK